MNENRKAPAPPRRKRRRRPGKFRRALHALSRAVLLLLLTVAVELLVHGGLLGVIALARLCAVLAIGVVIQILFIVIHKSNLLEKRALICVPPGTSLTLIVV